MHAELRRKGYAINRKKVERIMRERDIRGITRRKRRHLTKQDTKAAPAPDLVGRDFTADTPGTKLVGDITYLPTIEGWWYLATVIDLATREVIGYAMADHHRAELVTDALRMAAGRGDLQRGCIMHTDRGSEYTSGEFRREISKLNLRQSMGRTGICYDKHLSSHCTSSPIGFTLRVLWPVGGGRGGCLAGRGAGWGPAAGRGRRSCRCTSRPRSVRPGATSRRSGR